MSFVTIENGGVRYLKSDLLPCPHAFSTRIGGVSALDIYIQLISARLRHLVEIHGSRKIVLIEYAFLIPSVHIDHFCGTGSYLQQFSEIEFIVPSLMSYPKMRRTAFRMIYVSVCHACR